MGIAAFNRMRQLKAAAKESVTVHAVAKKAETSEQSGLLQLLNNATEVNDLTDLSEIGRGSAKKLLANRPEDGYASVEDAIALNVELANPPYRVNWDNVLSSFTEAV